MTHHSDFRRSSAVLWLLGLILIWAPIPLGSNRPWAWELLHGLIAIAAIVHCLSVLRTGRSLWPDRQHWLLLAGPALIALYLALQLSGLCEFITTVDAYQTGIMLRKTLFLLLFAYLLLCHCQRHRQLRLILGCILVSGGIQAVYGSLLHLSGTELSPIFGIPEEDRARGSFVYQNHFANYLALCLSLAIGWMLSELSTESRPWRQWLHQLAELVLSKKLLLRLAIILMVVALVLSRSRMGNAGFFAALAAVALLALFIYRNPPPFLKWLVLSIFVLDILLIGSMFGVEKVKQRMQETSFASEARDEVVLHSLPILQQQGLTGSGGGSFYTVFPGYQQGSYSGFYDHAHNDYLQFALELGWPVTVLLGLWALVSLWHCLWVMNQRRTRLYQGVAFGCCVALVHMGLHSTVDFSLQAPANSLLFVTIICLAYLVRSLPAPRRGSA